MKQCNEYGYYSDKEMQYDYIVAMGISTGGPKLLSQVIKSLNENL